MIVNLIMKLKVNFVRKISKAAMINEIVFIKNKTNKSIVDNELFKEQLFIQKEQNGKNKIFVNCIKATLSKDYEKMGSKLFDYLKNNKKQKSFIDSDKSNINKINLEKILHGAKLKSYNFDIYKSNNKKNQTIELNIGGEKNNTTNILRKKLNALQELKNP